MSINREILKSSERIRRKRLLRYLAVITLTLAFFLAFTATVAHLKKLYITRIFIAGNIEVDSRSIFEEAKQILVGNYYGIYPRNNILIYPKEEIYQTLVKKFPRLGDIAIGASAGYLKITVSEREPKYLWCDDLLKSTLERTCYFLDKNGFAFDRSPTFSSHVYLEFYGGDKRGGYIGKAILPTEKFIPIIAVVESLEKELHSLSGRLGKLYGVNLQKNGDVELLVSSDRSEWKIIFDLNSDATGKFRAIVASPFFRKEVDDPRSKLEYIDLRFGKKVFYKFNRGDASASE